MLPDCCLSSSSALGSCGFAKTNAEGNVAFCEPEFIPMTWALGLGPSEITVISEKCKM